jgi:hypothetical protein
MAHGFAKANQFEVSVSQSASVITTTIILFNFKFARVLSPRPTTKPNQTKPNQTKPNQMNIIIPTLETELVNTNPITATHAAPDRSSRYGFISTQEIVDALGESGYTPRQIQFGKVRREEKRGFQKHIIKFQHSDITNIGGEVAPEFVLINSHDGTSSAQLSLGLRVFACLNGLVTGDIFQTLKVYHRNTSVSDFISAANDLRSNVPQLVERVSLFKNKELTQAATNQYLIDALSLRYDAPNEESTYADQREWNTRLFYLNRARRYADGGTNLWQTFNRVQENLTKGRPGSGIRKLTAPAADLKVNKQLWNLTEQYLLN